MSSFWNDLSRHLGNAKFQRAYADMAQQIRAEQDAGDGGSHDCTWPDEYDPWRCTNVMWEVRDGRKSQHFCAASGDYEHDHCCIHGTRWPQAKPRRTWRDRLLRRKAKR